MASEIVTAWWIANSGVDRSVDNPYDLPEYFYGMRNFAAKGIPSWTARSVCDICRRYIFIGGEDKTFSGTLFCASGRCPDELAKGGCALDTPVTPERLEAWYRYVLGKLAADARHLEQDMAIRKARGDGDWDGGHVYQVSLPWRHR